MSPAALRSFAFENKPISVIIHVLASLKMFQNPFKIASFFTFKIRLQNVLKDAATHHIKM
jgi:hypothetical protein